MPVRVTKVALQHLALVAARHPTLGAQDDFVVAVDDLGIFWLLVAITTVLRAVVMLVPKSRDGTRHTYRGNFLTSSE